MDAYSVVSYSLPLRAIAQKREKSAVVKNPLDLIMKPLLIVVTVDVLAQQPCSIASKASRSVLIMLIYLSHSLIPFKQRYVQHNSCPPHLPSSPSIRAFLPPQSNSRPRATSQSSLLLHQAHTLNHPSSPSKNTNMAPRGNRGRSSADPLKRELDEMSSLERGKPFYIPLL